MEYLHSTAPGLRTDKQETEEALSLRASTCFPFTCGCKPDQNEQGTRSDLCGQTGAQGGARLCRYGQSLIHLICAVFHVADRER